MRNLILILMLALPFASFSQTWADDSSLDDILNSQSAFGDDETSIVVVEFWAKFNEANAFSDWNKLQGVQYVRVDIAKAAKAKTLFMECKFVFLAHAKNYSFNLCLNVNSCCTFFFKIFASSV